MGHRCLANKMETEAPKWIKGHHTGPDRQRGITLKSNSMGETLMEHRMTQR